MSGGSSGFGRLTADLTGPLTDGPARPVPRRRGVGMARERVRQRRASLDTAAHDRRRRRRSRHVDLRYRMVRPARPRLLAPGARDRRRTARRLLGVPLGPEHQLAGLPSGPEATSRQDCVWISRWANGARCTSPDATRRSTATSTVRVWSGWRRTAARPSASNITKSVRGRSTRPTRLPRPAFEPVVSTIGSWPAWKRV